MSTNNLAIIQARMGSTRLPGKVLRLLNGVPVVAWVVRRVMASSRVDGVVVATSSEPEDDPVEETARRFGAQVYRGSVENVLSRYCAAAAEQDASVVIRVTADCPLYDPEVLTAMLGRWESARAAGERLDYLSNTWGRRTWPRGLDTEVFSRETLERACRNASQPYELEHVTPYIYTHPEAFAMAGFESDLDLSHHRWTLDTLEDWGLIEAVYEALGDGERIFSTAEVVAWLDAHPEVVALNAGVRQKQLGE